MEDGGDTHCLRSPTDVTAKTNVEKRRDANVAYEVLSLSSERQVAPGFVSPVHSHV